MAEYKLMQHQKDAVDFLDRMDGVGALLFDPGTGKTGSTLAWIDKLAKTKGEVRVLVFAPLTAVDTWVLQAPKFMDSVVKARMMQGPSTKILKGIAQSRSWGSVVDAKIATDHKGSTASQVSGNRVTILSASVGIPNGRDLPPGLGISTRRTGQGRYVPSFKLAAIPARNAPTPPC